jgi:hypothetical protein
VQTLVYEQINSNFNPEVSVYESNALTEGMSTIIQQGKTTDVIVRKIKLNNKEAKFFMDVNLNSLEQEKMAIINQLSPYYGFESQDEVVNFLMNNYCILKILPIMAERVKAGLDEKAKLTLKMLDEGENWKTLFINIHTSKQWETANSFVDKQLDFLFQLGSSVSLNLNFEICPL